MDYLNTFDYVVIAVYFSALVGLGLYLKRRASQSLEDYFIGGRRMPWWALGISGMANFLDITGTMVITSFLFMLGPRGLFIEFRGGAVLGLIFMMLWGGKWHRRSQCLTSAEWMIFRFGDGPGGRFAQGACVISGVVTTIGMLAYLIKGVGMFLSMFLPFSPMACAMILIGVATVYTMVSGFYGVVFTDIFQSAIILIAVVMVTVMAIAHVYGGEDLAALAESVTGNSRWLSGVPHLKTHMPAGYTQYSDLFMFMVFYALRNIFVGISSGNDPKYFGARNDRECGTLSFLWIWLMMFRWPMMMGFAIVGLYLVRDLFPDQGVLVQAAELIKTHCSHATPENWATITANIINHPDQCSGALLSGLQQLFGEDWQDKLRLLGFHGAVNPEKILPAVLLFKIWPGLRGLLLVALVAACMSTFDSTVNATCGLMTRDVYQKYIRPKAKTKELIYVSWFFVAFLVALAFFMAYSVQSINDIWGWIIMGLGGGLLAPMLLRLIWWRFNGSGFATGVVIGLLAAVIQRMINPDLDERLQFLLLSMIGTLAAIIGAYLGKPEEDATVNRFYQKTRPFGLWGPYRKRLPDAIRQKMDKEHFYDFVALPFVSLWHVNLFLLPMLLLCQSWKQAGVSAILFVIGLIGAYFFWYKQLLPVDDPLWPPEEEGDAEQGR